jgi:hypothetical protein
LTKEGTVKYIKAQVTSIMWWGRLNGMGDVKLVKKIIDWNPIGVKN